MATVGYNNGGREGQSAVNRSEADRRRRQVRVAQSFANRRLSAALMTPPVVVDDVPADQNLKVMLQKDILNVVVSSVEAECEVTRDADGGIRIYLPTGASLGGGSGLTHPQVLARGLGA